jgi:hypothetical protein
MHLHPYPLLVGTICILHLSNIEIFRTALTYPEFDLGSMGGILLSTLNILSVALERILPAITGLMPEKAPIVVFLLQGCNALSTRIPYPTKQIDSEAERRVAIVR